MKIAMAFFAGCVTLVLMMVIKIPIKKLTRVLAEKLETYERDSDVLYKRFNIIIILMTFLVAVICSYFIYCVLGITHFKMCYALKAGAIAMALYALYEQWFGEV